MHGGLSPSLDTLDDIHELDRVVEVTTYEDVFSCVLYECMYVCMYVYTLDDIHELD